MSSSSKLEHRRQKWVLGVFLVLGLTLRAAPVAQAPEALLKRADVGAIVPLAFRARVSMREGGQDGTREIELYRSGAERTLVRLLDPKDRGKFLLRRGSDMWLLTPTAKKPVRLSPAQRLYGAASLDVLLGLHLAESYRIAAARAESSPRGPLQVFDLEATSETQTFASVRYAVLVGAARPASALYRLRSGRDATRIEFLDWVEGGRYARRIEVHDLLRKDATTEITVLECEERPVPAALFDLTDGTAREALSAGPKAASPKAF
jgi:hypothetical protein